jgi:RNA polymerase sigma factor (sigma-70 family)
MADQTREDRPYEDWSAIMEALLRGAPDQQQLAFAKLNRLLSSFFVDFRAWDHLDDWEDLRQLVLMKLVKSFSYGHLREAKAFVAYARTVTRNEFFDFLKERLYRETANFSTIEEEETQGQETTHAVRAALRRLPDDQQRAVRAVYLEGRTYAEAAAETAIPLGSLKRYLRLAVAQLRKQLFEAE